MVLAGDYNVIPAEQDVYKPERWVNDALFRVEVREAFARLKAQGWTDAIRTLHPEAKIYTFWDFFRDAYGRDAGLRIDHLLLNKALRPRLHGRRSRPRRARLGTTQRSRPHLDHARAVTPATDSR